MPLWMTVATPVFAGFDGVGLLVAEDVLEDALLSAAVDRLEDLARLDPALAVDLAVLLLDPVAGDAAHALARNLAHGPKRRLARLAKLGTDLLVAAHAESADRTFGQLLELLLERVEHRRDRRIGMLRRTPFIVDLLMAFATLRGGGIEGEGLLVDGGDGSFLTLLGSCCGGERRHLPMAVRFRLRRQLLLAAGFLCGRFRILGESILAKECRATQDGACESTGKDHITHHPHHPTTLIPHRPQGAIPICVAHADAALNRCAASIAPPFSRAAQLDRLSFTQRRIHRAGAVVPARWTILGW